MENFGIILKNLREKRGLTLEQLAKDICIDKFALSLWEKDKKVLSLSKLIKLAKYFEVSMDYLLGL